MDTIIRTVFAYKPKEKATAPNNKPLKDSMDQKYKYVSQSNSFIKVD